MEPKCYFAPDTIQPTQHDYGGVAEALWPRGADMIIAETLEYSETC